MLLIPPLLVLLLAISAAIRPLEIPLGPMVLIVASDDDLPQARWEVGGHAVLPQSRPMNIAGVGEYLVVGPGHLGVFQCHRWGYGVMWFRGRRL
ncbi:MAG: hypothetical protein ACO1SX_17335 [Actinomycetota bacterium]